MSLKLKNNWTYTGHDRWDWELYLDCDSPDELTEVKNVRYILHPTFKNPIREVDNPNEGFKLKTNGWGSFKVKAFVYLKNGNKIKLEHFLKLPYNPPKGTSN